MTLTLSFADDWKRVLKRAWSIRLILLAGIFQGLEAILPLFEFHVSHGLFTLMTTLTLAAAFVTRLLAQNGFPNEFEDQKTAE